MNHLALSIIEPQSDFAERFTSVFHEKKKHQEESIGIFPLRSGKSSDEDIWIILNPEISRETFHDVCTSMKEEYPQLKIDYFSPIDGEETSGIREQDVNTSTSYSYHGIKFDASRIVEPLFDGSQRYPFRSLKESSLIP